MPNHYHFLIKQIQDYGITEFMHKLDTSYTKYFNMNHKRSGRLFENTFKAKMIESDEVLIHISRYIHLNAPVKHLVEHPIEWRWSSYQEYFNPEIKSICDHQEILGRFRSPDRYRAFVEDPSAFSGLMNEIELEKDQDEDALFL